MSPFVGQLAAQPRLISQNFQLLCVLTAFEEKVVLPKLLTFFIFSKFYIGDRATRVKCFCQMRHSATIAHPLDLFLCKLQFYAQRSLLELSRHAFLADTCSPMALAIMSSRWQVFIDRVGDGSIPSHRAWGKQQKRNHHHVSNHHSILASRTECMRGRQASNNTSGRRKT